MSSRIASVPVKRRRLLAAMAVAPVAGMMTRVPTAQAQDPIVVTDEEPRFVCLECGFSEGERAADQALLKPPPELFFARLSLRPTHTV